MRRSALSILGLLVVSLFVSVRATAAESQVDYGQKRMSNTVIVMNRHDLVRMAKSLGLAIRAIPLSTAMREKIASSARKGCGCAVAPDGLDGFGSCFNQCLTDWHVNQTTILACEGTCAAAGTGNPVAIAFCAACLGVGEWIVAGCAMKCVYAGIGGKEIGGFMSKNLRHKLHLPAESQTKRPRKTVGIRT